VDSGKGFEDMGPAFDAERPGGGIEMDGRHDGAHLGSTSDPLTGVSSMLAPIAALLLSPAFCPAPPVMLPTDGPAGLAPSSVH